MEDASTAVLDMPTLDEQAPESPLSSLEMSRSTTRDYNPMPDSPHDMPLLQPDDSFTEPHNSPNTNHNNDRVRNRSSQRLPPPENALVRDRPSFDTLISTEESQSESALIRAHPHPPALDPRGEAPPYFQVVPMDTLVPTTTNTSVSAASLMPSTPELTPSTATTTTAGSTPDPLLPETRRRSGFFGLFNHRPNSLLRPPVPIISPPATINLTTHTRGESTHSALSIPTTSGDGHLPSRSHSPSSSNFIHARTRSRSTHRPSHSGGSNSVFSIGSQALRSLTRQKSFTSSSSTTRHPSPFLDPNLLSSPSSISLNSISAPLTHTLVRTEFMYPKSGPTPEQIRLISGREAVGGKFGVPYGIDAIRYAASQTDLGGGPPPPNFEDVAGEEQGVVVVPASPITSSGPSPSPSSGPSPSPSSGPSPSDSPLPSNSPSNSQEQEGENVSLKKSMTLGVPTTREGTVQGPPSAFKGVGVLGGGSGGRSESRASSYMSFATAEESLVEEGEVEEGEVEDGGDADGGDADADADGVPKLQVSMSARAGAASSRGDEGVDDADDREERDVVDDTPIALPQEYGNEHGHEHEHGHGHGNEDTDVTLTLSTPIGKDDGSLGR